MLRRNVQREPELASVREDDEHWAASARSSSASSQSEEWWAVPNNPVTSDDGQTQDTVRMAKARRALRRHIGEQHVQHIGNHFQEGITRTRV